MRKILEDTVNGNNIIQKEFDSHVIELDANKDSINHALKVDFSCILCASATKQTMAIFDLLDLRIKRGSDYMEPFTKLIKHPVMALFIAEKWKKTKAYFYTQSFIFISFLLSYSAFIINFFTRPDDYCSELEKIIFQKNSSSIKSSFVLGGERYKDEHHCQKQTIRMSKKFMANPLDDPFIVCEFCLMMFFSFLFVIEIYQAVVLRKQYFKELENYIEWVVLICTFLTMVLMEHIHQNTSQAAFIRGIAALGICAAWLELIFIIGRYPFRGGDFSIMFYNIIKKLARYLFAMFLMIIGFAFAFMVVNFGHDQESFENPIKSSIKTLTMALGEYNFEDMYNIFKEDSISRGFAMILLVLLILFGTITMVNLFIAVIISDITQLREDVYTQNLINMAQCSILVEELLPSCILNKMRVKNTINVCMHELCPKGCKGTRLPPNMKVVFEHLDKIAQKKAEMNKKTKDEERKGSSIYTQTTILKSGNAFY